MVQQAALPPLVRGRRYPMSWDEFLVWAPNEGQAEWVDGEGIAYVSNSLLHVRMLAFWVDLLRLYVRVFDLGEVFADQMLMRLPTRPSGRMPDLFVIGRDDAPRLHDQWFEGPALFATEFLSEDDPERDAVEKLQEYGDAGLPEYLWVDARLGRRDFRFNRHDGTGYRLVEPDENGHYHSEVLQGFWFDPEWFWQDPLPDPNRLMLQIAPEAYRRYLVSLLAEE